MDAETARLFEGTFEVEWVDESQEAVKAAQSTIRSIFGEELRLDDLARLVAAPAGSKVRVDSDSQAVLIEVHHRSLGLSMLRSFRKTEDGIVAEHGWIESAIKGRRIGTRIFAVQIRNYRRQGIARIETYAAGSPGGTLNGYATWAKLGFNAPFSWEQASLLEDAGFEANDLHELFLLYPDDAPDWWEKAGWAFEGVFDLREGSRSLVRLTAYLKERGIET